jgi:hypothetical protein
VIPARSNYVDSVDVPLLDFVRKAPPKTTYIFPDLVMKLEGNNVTIRNVVVAENGLSFWTRRVHMFARYRIRGKKKSGVVKKEWNGEGKHT